MKKNKISIIFLLFKTPLKAIKNIKNYKDFDLYILDQSNNKNVKNIIKKKFSNIKYYAYTNKNLGFAKGINFLAQKVKSKYFLCTQPDVIINKKSILKLEKTLKEKKDCILSVPKITLFKNYKNKDLKKKVFEVNKILGAIFLTDKNRFKKFKMFDERFFFYWEDVDLCKRIEKSDFKIYLNSDAVAYHKGENSVKPNLKTFIIRKVNFKYGEYLFQKKYNTLKTIKILREIVKYPFLSIFFLLSFRYKTSFENICFFYAVLKYIFFGKFKKFD